MIEAGVPGYEATIWLGMMAPNTTPRAVLERLNGEITKITSRAEVRGMGIGSSKALFAETPL